MDNLMKTKEEVYDLLAGINEDAHDQAYDSWDEAEQEDSEELREDASEEQAGYFRKILEQTPGLLEEAKHYAEQDEDFKSDWEAWYQPWLDGGEGNG